MSFLFSPIDTIGRAFRIATISCWQVCMHYIVTMVNWERCKSERYGRGGRRSTVTLTKKLFFTRGASRKNR
nr:hypothetical protein CFP56_76106 [Quercus suber]